MPTRYHATRRDSFVVRHASLALATLALLSFAVEGQALVLGTWAQPGVGGSSTVTPSSVNTTAPADDPGWANSGGGRSAIYLGDQWVLTARHVSTGSIILPSGTYEPVPGTEVILSNPSSFLGTALSSQSDLKLFRIQTHSTTGLTPEEMDPNVQSIQIATQTPTLGTQITAIAAGNRRRVHPSQPNGHFRFNSSFQLTSDAAAPYRGYFFEQLPTGGSVREKAWGTNRIDNPAGVTGLTDNGLNAVISVPGLNDTIGLVSRFDQAFNDSGNVVEPSATADEFQGSGGDSGGPIFVKNGLGEWTLLGVFHGIYLLDGQPTAGTVPMFGQHTGFSDLSNSHYYNQIDLLRNSQQYSVMGDTNLDGVVSGEVNSGGATGDLANLVNNWLTTHSATGVQAWKRGDLNQDGITDIGDFVLWRQGAGGTVSVEAFAALVGAGAIPEPTSVGLTCLLLGLASARRRR
ncbi:PEP-CTERM sorting domain-containing protein [Botrimarina hoheduenensis]|uniref:Trypsin n=1 Tax=Botrimarina hoheduenensis TaxID=2528000 RepID=A0A5C5VWS4_9BACT|nr:PEP-CTERM sorting domain-containing protein [Botrimarina hoheduenensis]TWT42557.1 hypothetical protein Pla111_28620 [Botrimarina hoheduenensis]